MAHNNHTESKRNQDLEGQRCWPYYRSLARRYHSSFSFPNVVETTNAFGEKVYIFDDSAIEVGSKARFGEYLIQHAISNKYKRIVYCQPRYGFAGVSLTWLCKKYGIDLVLFMPAAKTLSQHQHYCISLGCEARFLRIAAMPNLNRAARIYCEDHPGSLFVPLGLKHELVTASIIETAYQIDKIYGVNEMWCAVSTGVLARGLQIGFPDARHWGVCVARNLKDGERGNMQLISHDKPFHSAAGSDIKEMCPVDSCDNYDLKCYEHFRYNSSPGAFMWNVAGNLDHSTEEDYGDFTMEWGEKQKVFKL